MADTEKIIIGFVAVVVIAAVALSLYTSRFLFFQKEEPQQGMMQQSMGRMGFTSFDAGLAKQFMDKDNDGKCDSCGMKIEDCIASGMMQCSMDPDAKMGVLRSAHLHADFKVYQDGKAMDFAKPDYYMKSMMLHLDDDANKEKAGSVLHMHATGVPLWLFFKSIGMDVSKLALYSNGKLNPEGLDYVFKEGDKLLLTDATDKEIIQQQALSVTSFAKEG